MNTVRNQIEMKTCTKCNETKSETEFHKQAKGRNGLQSQCKSCGKIYQIGPDESGKKTRPKKVEKLKAKVALPPGVLSITTHKLDGRDERFSVLGNKKVAA